MKKEELPHPDLGRYWPKVFCLLVACFCLFVARSFRWLLAWSVGRLVACLLAWLLGFLAAWLLVAFLARRVGGLLV